MTNAVLESSPVKWLRTAESSLVTLVEDSFKYGRHDDGREDEDQ